LRPLPRRNRQLALPPLPPLALVLLRPRQRQPRQLFLLLHLLLHPLLPQLTAVAMRSVPELALAQARVRT
jgi:hypothetical protein